VAIGPGTRIGPYEITALIGEGGMGQVWRAHHTALKRDDALKVLPDAFASDPGRLARFQREAQVLASLNHPNIAHVYGLEHANGTQALVMELVEGPTLADRLAGGAMPVEEALTIARQIAEALEAAHEQGIVHRDLKPANVKVRLNGTVKVLDFGLAKAMEPATGAAPANSQLLTITTPAMTQAGIILGTAAYMSPEQARGKPVDKRTDIWAFGCLLFELLTGRCAFVAEDMSETLATILKSEPDWTALPATTPPTIRSLLRRCLQRDPQRRLRDISDARFQIEDALSEPLAVAVSSRTSDVGNRLTWAVGGFVVAAAAAAAIWYSMLPATQTEEVRFEISTPAMSA
jgi:eukaryotic-like serine/threonine-protein kinase